MKIFIIALIILIVLSSSVILSTRSTVSMCNELIKEAEALPRNITGADVSAFNIKWKEYKPFFCITVSHKETDAIDDTLTKLSADIKSGYEEGYVFSREALISTLERLKNSESLSFDRIF